jgi:anti-anti-sigma regulatory factor
MAANVETPLHLAPPGTRLLGETVGVVSAGPWFSAITSATFADLAAELHDAGARSLVLDLTGVRAVDAAGTATLGALAEQLEDVGCDIAVAAVHPGLVAWVATGPLDVDLAVHETVDEALADLLRRPV